MQRSSSTWWNLFCANHFCFLPCLHWQNACSACQTRVPGLPGQKGEKGSLGAQGAEGLVGEKVRVTHQHDRPYGPNVFIITLHDMLNFLLGAACSILKEYLVTLYMKVISVMHNKHIHKTLQLQLWVGKNRFPDKSQFFVPFFFNRFLNVWFYFFLFSLNC